MTAVTNKYKYPNPDVFKPNNKTDSIPTINIVSNADNGFQITCQRVVQ